MTSNKNPHATDLVTANEAVATANEAMAFWTELFNSFVFSKDFSAADEAAMELEAARLQLQRARSARGQAAAKVAAWDKQAGEIARLEGQVQQGEAALARLLRQAQPGQVGGGLSGLAARRAETKATECRLRDLRGRLWRARLDLNPEEAMAA